jgi:hypothetical protein
LAHPSGIDIKDDIHKIIPNIDRQPDIDLIPKPRIIKTHSPYNRKLKRVIYLLRDGRDSVFSYYNFAKKAFGYKGDFLDFLTNDECKCYGVKWHEHVESWLSQDHISEILLIKYEDIVEDFIGQFSKILNFCGWKVNEDTLSKIEMETKLKNMKKKERQGMFLAHVGAGTKGTWINNYSKEELRVFLNYSKETLIKFGYLNEEA